MATSAPSTPEFTLTCGGPLYRLYLLSGLARPPLELSRARLIALVLLMWVPLLVLSIIGGHALGGTDVPFLKDFEVQTRLLIALPLLIIQEHWAQRWLPGAIHQFLDRGIVRPQDRDRFASIVDGSVRLQSSRWAELVIVLVVVSAGRLLWKERLFLQTNTWYSTADRQLLLPGYWYLFISLPIFQFVLFRWYYRLLIWYRLLWQISRMPLHLNALHPDQAAGLGFLARTIRGFELLFATHSVLIAGAIANHVLHEGTPLMSFKLEVIGIVVLVVFLAFFPLTFFTPKLIEAEHENSREYGIFGSEYVDHFRSRWLRHPRDEEMLGTADIQSLSDLGNSFMIASGTKPLPFKKEGVIELLTFVVVPLLPLVLIVVPVDQLIDRIFKMIL